MNDIHTLGMNSPVAMAILDYVVLLVNPFFSIFPCRDKWFRFRVGFLS